MLTMIQRGAWWKGRTDKHVEVSISNAFFRHIQARHIETRIQRPGNYLRVAEHYDGLMGCDHPQWWVDVFRDCRDGVGLTPHVWTHRKGYAKVVLQPDDDKYARVQVPKPGGTLIFRTLPPPEKSPGVS